MSGVAVRCQQYQCDDKYIEEICIFGWPLTEETKKHSPTKNIARFIEVENKIRFVEKAHSDVKTQTKLHKTVNV